MKIVICIILIYHYLKKSMYLLVPYYILTVLRTRGTKISQRVTKWILWKCCQVYTFENNSNKSNFLKVLYNITADWIRKMLIPIDPLSFIFPFSIWERKYQSMQHYCFACSFVWLWNLVSHFRDTTVAEVGSEYVAEEDVWR